jgi:DNA-binding transcriptional LysR family regulator
MTGQTVTAMVVKGLPTMHGPNVGTSSDHRSTLRAGRMATKFAGHPRVICHVIIGVHETICGALEERDVDVVISAITAPFAEDHRQAEALYTGSRFVVAAAENPWARRRRVGLADLMNEPWTLPPPNSLAGAIANDDYRAARLDVPRAAVIIPTDVARLALVAKGRFLTIAFKSAFAAWDTAVKTLPIDLALRLTRSASLH